MLIKILLSIVLTNSLSSCAASHEKIKVPDANINTSSEVLGRSSYIFDIAVILALIVGVYLVFKLIRLLIEKGSLLSFRDGSAVFDLRNKVQNQTKGVSEMKVEITVTGKSGEMIPLLQNYKRVSITPTVGESYVANFTHDVADLEIKAETVSFKTVKPMAQT